MNPTPGERPDWVDDALLPFDSHFVEVDDCVVHHLDEGPRDAPVLLMLHGNPTWSFLYRDMVADLSTDYRCIAPDHPGMGLSSARRGYAFGPEEHARVLAGLVEALDLSEVTLVMQDWGGPIGMAAAATAPQRYAGLVLGNTWFWPLPHVRAKAFSWLMGGPVGTLAHRHLNAFVEQLIPRMHMLRPPGRAEMAMWRGPYPTAASREPTHVFPERIVGARPFLAQTLYDAMATGLVDLPALLLWAPRDPAFGRDVLRRHTDILGDHTTVWLEGAGHYWQDDAPDQACRAIRDWMGPAAGDRAGVTPT